MHHVMIDLETWGTSPGSALRSLGAVVFYPDDAEKPVTQTFYANIEDASCEAFGLVREKGTEDWWEGQNDAAKAALLVDQRPLGDVLLEFAAWWKKEKAQFVWGHGANFDPVLLESAYAAAMLDPPWDFWNVRCCRTVLALANRKPDRRKTDTHHNALHDAIAQARSVTAAFKFQQFAPR